MSDLFLTFRVGDDRYAISAAQIVEVLPLVAVRPIPQAAAGVAGIFLYRGAPIPAVDLSAVLIDRAAEARASTRLLIVHYLDEGGHTRLLGLIAERATGTIRCARAQFAWSGVSGAATAARGPIATDADGLVQWIDPQTVLPPAIRAGLFQDGVA